MLLESGQLRVSARIGLELLEGKWGYLMNDDGQFRQDIPTDGEIGYMLTVYSLVDAMLERGQIDANQWLVLREAGADLVNLREEVAGAWGLIGEGGSVPQGHFQGERIQAMAFKLPRNRVGKEREY